jgi:inorganic triphosphatase YgiF
MEIEAKYRVGPADLDRVAALRALGPYTLTPAPEPELQENRYFDTADRRLTAARYGLRVRRIGALSLITLKGPPSVGAGGVHRRAEHEFPGEDPDPATWPPGAARDLAMALLGGAPLTPTVAVSTERRILHAALEGITVAEICLDLGLLRGGGRERPFSELEIELLAGGQSDDLGRIAAELSRHITLGHEPRSKLQRALDLAAGNEPL